MQIIDTNLEGVVLFIEDIPKGLSVGTLDPVEQVFDNISVDDPL